MMRTDQSNDKSGSPLFSILIPTWNNLDFLKLCVGSIRRNSRFTHQIIVHINEGGDGSGEWAEAENIDHTRSSENVGVCGALNAAYTLAKSDYVVYLNDDMYVCPDWDYYLWEAVRQAGNDMFFFSSTAIEPKDAGKKCAIAPFSFGRTAADFEEERLLSTYDKYEFSDWNGASWPPNIVHRRLWELVGGYSPEFFPGFYSDPDFAMKLWQAGVRNFRGISTSRAYHFLEVSTNKLKKQKVKLANGLFLRKWGISAKMFNQFYLRMGSPYGGPLNEPEMNIGYIWKQLCCRVKRIFV